MLTLQVAAFHIPARVTRFGGTQNASVREGHFAMCAAANSQIITKTPVVQIVLTLIARLRIRRRFVLLIPRRGQKLVALLEDIPQRVIVRQHRRTGTKQGVRLNGQLIPRQMRRIQFNRLTQIVQRFFERLIRQAMHQVEVKAA